jgi:FkbM family methyltransferase
MKRLVEHLRRVGDEERIRSAAVMHGRLDYPAAVIHMSLTSREEFHRLSSCSKEPWTVRWIEERIQPGEVLYDIGANVGAYSLVAAVASGAHVIAFEPGPANFAALAANVQLNAVGDRVQPVPIALGDSPRSAPVAGDGAVPGRALRVGDRGGQEIGAVLVDTLDDFVRRYGLQAPDHLKLDVDGDELAVLRGAQELLGSRRVRSLMVELGDEDGIRAHLEAADYELVDRFTGETQQPASPAYGLFATR